jgi:copper chaperone
MKQTYQINGMKCSGCVISVQQALEALPQVQKAEVQLQPQQATIESEAPLSIEALRTAVSKAGNYSITPAEERAS